MQSQHLASDSVTEEKIAAGAISTDEIQDGCVTLSKLAPDVFSAIVRKLSSMVTLNSIVFITVFKDNLPSVDREDKYAFNGTELYKSVKTNNGIEWAKVLSEPNKIYVDKSTAQSYVSDKQGSLIRLDKEEANILYDVERNI